MPFALRLGRRLALCQGPGGQRKFFVGERQRKPLSDFTAAGVSSRSERGLLELEEDSDAFFWNREPSS